MPRPKIALLYVGGSIGMKVNQKTHRIEPIESLTEIHRFLPELQREVSLTFYSLTNVGSSDVTPANWVEIAEKINEIYDEYEGFVVVHGSNTLSYTAAALSFALQGLSKPVVLTGALHPINDIAGDGRMNLIYAIRTAQQDIAEVCVVFGPRVLRGNRVKKVDQSLFKTFDTLTMPALAEFNLGIHLHPDRFVRRKRTLKCIPSFDPQIRIITIFPGIFDSKCLDAMLKSEPHGIVLRTYGPGMLPESLFDWLREVTKANIPIVTTSQAVRGQVDLQRYRRQLTLERLGVMSGSNMTFECAATKLMWTITQAKNMGRLRDIIEKNLVGEFDETRR
ncbi:MAG: asparaginase [Candidatus Peribacteraceae bacterium]|nr:asparaginase [Candidatus Peribacteraceae bacterium]MDP7645547.1 asparaginase [Candidatus Peribacteraceae bacterium]